MAKETTPCYKVVQKIERGRLVSAVVNDIPFLCVDYPPRRWVKREDGLPIFTFKSLDAARVFLRDDPGLLIYEAIGRDPVPMPTTRWDIAGERFPTIVSVYDLRYAARAEYLTEVWMKGVLSSFASADPPSGTLLFKEVRLLRRVE